MGVSFSIFALLLIATGLWMAQRAGLKPARESYWLVLVIALLSLVSVMRAEPFTLFTSRLLVLVLLGLLALSFHPELTADPRVHAWFLREFLGTR